MGLRTPPQRLRGNPAQSPPNARAVFRNPSGAQLGPGIVRGAQNFVRGVQDRQRQEEAARKQREDFLAALTKNKLDTVRVEAQSKIAQLQGSNVFERTPDIKRDYIEAVSEIMQEVPEEFRNSPKIQLGLARNAGDLDRFEIGHSVRETNRIQKEVYDARVANDINSFSENAYDLNYLQGEGLATVEQSIREKAAAEYGTDQNGQMLAQREVNLGVSKAIKQAVTMQLAAENIPMAEQTIARMYDRITDDDKVELAKMVDRARVDNSDDTAFNLANEAMQVTNGNIGASERYIRALSQGDAEIYRKAMTFANTRNEVAKKEKEERDRQSFNTVYSQMINTGTYDRQLYMGMEPQDRRRLQKLLAENGGRAAVISQRGALDHAHRSMDRLTPEETVNINIDEAYQHSLSFEDRQQLKKRQRLAQRQIERGIEAGQDWNSSIYKETTQSIAASAGIIPNTPAYADLERKVVDKYYQILEQNPRMDEREVRMKLRRDVYDSVRTLERDSNFFGRAIESLGNATGLFNYTAGDEVEVFDIPEEGFNNDLDAREVRRINGLRRRRGQAPYTEQQIEAFRDFQLRRRQNLQR